MCGPARSGYELDQTSEELHRLQGPGTAVFGVGSCRLLVSDPVDQVAFSLQEQPRTAWCAHQIGHRRKGLGIRSAFIQRPLFSVADADSTCQVPLNDQPGKACTASENLIPQDSRGRRRPIRSGSLEFNHVALWIPDVHRWSFTVSSGPLDHFSWNHTIGIQVPCDGLRVEGLHP